MSKPAWREPDGHVSTAALMLHLEGELGKDAAEVSRHLQQCWVCRERLEWMNQGVFTFLDYYRNVLAPGSPAAGQPSDLPRALRCEIARPVAAGRLREMLRKVTGAALRVSVPAWITTIASVGLFVVLPFLSVVEPPQLTAAEFLERVCQPRALSARVHGPAERRRVRIRRGHQVFYSDSTGAVTGHSPQPDSAVLTALTIAHVDRRDPLNPRDFVEWHRTVKSPRDVIRESDRSITLETTVAVDGPLRMAALTVDRSDWRPIAHHIEFRDQPSIDVEELPAGFPSPPIASVAQTHDPVASTAVAPTGTGPTDSQLDEAEVELREALFGVQADRYAAPVIRRGPQSIALLALAASDAQRDQLLAAVQDIPFVTPRIVTPQTKEAANEQATASPVLATPASSPRRRRPPLADQLRQYCGGLDEANAYLAALAESHSETLMASSALTSLAARYSKADEDRLPADLQIRLSRLVGDYVARLQRGAHAYEALASPVLDAMLRETKTRTEPKQPTTSQRSLEWREESVTVAEQVQRMESIFTLLFAVPGGEDTAIPVAPGTLLLECDRARSELKQALAAVTAKPSPVGQIP